MQTRTVIVIGGGFAGWATILQLQQYNPTRTQIILIDNKEYFENTTGLTSFLAQRSFDENAELHFNHDKHLTHAAQLVCGDVTEVSTEEVVVVRHSRNKGTETARLRYDCLVICSGRKYRLVDQEDRTLSGRLKFINTQKDAIKNAETLLVVGGGPTGVELAAELASNNPDKSVTIMHRGPHLIPRTCRTSSLYADTVLKDKHVHVVCQKESTLIDRTASIPKMVPRIYDVIFPCIGGAPNTDFMEPHLSSFLDEKKAIKVNEYFQLEGLPNIFAIGDVTTTPEEKTAERAITHGEIVARHVKRFLKKKSLGLHGYVAKQAPFMQVISLGPDNGIALLAGEQVAEGLSTAKMKRHYISTAYTSLTSKLVMNKRHSLYGLVSKSPPIVPLPPSPPPVTPQVDEPNVERPKSIRMCCFSPSASEAEIKTVQGRSVSPPITQQQVTKRRPLRPTTSAVGLLDITDDFAEQPLLDPQVLIIGGDNRVSRLLIEALAHTGLRTRAALRMHSWITHSASYKLSHSMLIHNVECVDYNTHEEKSLDVLLEGIQVVLLPIDITPIEQLIVLMNSLSRHQSLKCVIYVHVNSDDPYFAQVEEMLTAYKLPLIIIRHCITMQSVRDVISRQIHWFRTMVWPEKGTKTCMIDIKDLCTALAMIFHEPRRHVGKVYQFLGPDALTGCDVATFLSSVSGEEITVVETSNEKIQNYLSTLNFSESEIQTWMSMTCAQPKQIRSFDLEIVLDQKPTSFLKWLSINIFHFCNVWKIPERKELSNLRRSSRQRSFSLGKNESPTLNEVLLDKHLSRKFLKFLQSEFCAENYMFWNSVEKFRESASIDDMITSAVEISNQYIYESGPNPINIDQKLRVSILTNMRMGLTKDIFDVAQDKVLRLMEMEVYPRFAKAAGLLPNSADDLLRTRSVEYRRRVLV